MNRPVTAPTPSLSALLRAARPRQWSKNALVVAAPVAAGVLDEREAFVDTVLAVVAFCMASAAVYLLNDAVDADADRLHPSKRLRPVAAGEVAVVEAGGAAATLALGALAISAAVRWELAAVTAAYLAVAATYSLVAKRVPYLELGFIASGFWLRAYAGAVAVDVPISAWFGVVVAAGAVFTVSGKRVAETHNLGDTTPTRAVLARYRPSWLAACQLAAGLVAVAGYVAWVATDRPSGVGGLPATLALLPLGVALARYWSLTRRGRGEEPEEVLLRDPVALAAVLVWCALYGVAVYG